MAAKMGETIAIFDKSGKAISTGKTLMGLFKEAKDAYKERKAEVTLQRQAQRNERRNTRLALEELHISETRSTGSRRIATRRHHSNTHHSSTRHASDPRREVSRRHTTRDRDAGTHHQQQQLTQRHRPQRSMSMPGADAAVDMNLAYGEVPPPLPVASTEDEVKLNTLVGRFNSLMDEAHCMQHSASAVIATLQRNPDAMAAVALTLAEISNVVAKVGPGVLATLKSSAPGIVALLASPQFLIAAGVGVGVTVIAFGGYKIVKKLQERSVEGKEADMEELREIGEEVSRIENWRRGIEQVREESEGVSVEGEFITQRAAELRRVGSVITRSNEAGYGVPRARSLRSERTERTERTGRKKEKKEKSKEKNRKEKKGTLGLLFSTSSRGHRQPRVVEI